MHFLLNKNIFTLKKATKLLNQSVYLCMFITYLLITSLCYLFRWTGIGSQHAGELYPWIGTIPPVWRWQATSGHV